MDLPTAPRATSQPRSLELAVAVLAALLALFVSALVGVGIYRSVYSTFKYHAAPRIGSLVFLLLLLLVAITFWVLTIRLLRGSGHWQTGSLLGPVGLRLAGGFLVVWTLFVVWGSFAVREHAYLLLALPAPPLAVMAFRRATRGRRGS